MGVPGRVRVGISGWTYPGWRGDFYPTGLVQRRELAHAAERLTSIEVNGSFYSLQRPASYRSWREQTPDDFVFSVKGGRFITHLRRLVDVEVPLANFFASGPLELGDTLGPVLWQLPERLLPTPEVLDAFLRVLPRTHGAAAERARHHDDKVPGGPDGLVEPEDLIAALHTVPSARAWWEASAPSYRRNVLCWLALARTPVTRAKRVEQIVRLAGRGEKVPQM